MTEAEMVIEDINIIHSCNRGSEIYINDAGERLFHSIGGGRFYERISNWSDGDVLYLQPTFIKETTDKTLYFAIRKATPDEVSMYVKHFS